MVTTASRRKRSSRNRRSLTAAGRSALVALMIQTSTGSLCVAPRRRTERLLEDLEEVGLQGLGQASPISSRNKVPRGWLAYSPGFECRASVKAPPLVPEQLGLEQGLGNGRAVDVDEGTLRPRAHPAQDARHQAFPGSGISLDEDRRGARRLVNPVHEPPDVGAEGLDGGTGTNQPFHGGPYLTSVRQLQRRPAPAIALGEVTEVSARDGSCA